MPLVVLLVGAMLLLLGALVSLVAACVSIVVGGFAVWRVWKNRNRKQGLWILSAGAFGAVVAFSLWRCLLWDELGGFPITQPLIAIDLGMCVCGFGVTSSLLLAYYERYRWLFDDAFATDKQSVAMPESTQLM